MSDNTTCFQAYRFYSSCCLEDTRWNHHSGDFRAVTLSTSIINRGHFVSCNSGRKCSDKDRSLEESSPQDTFLSSFIRFGIYWPLYRSRHPPCTRCSRIDFLKEFLRNRETTVISCLRKAPCNSLWKLLCFLNYNTCESNVNWKMATHGSSIFSDCSSLLHHGANSAPSSDPSVFFFLEFKEADLLNNFHFPRY